MSDETLFDAGPTIEWRRENMPPLVEKSAGQKMTERNNRMLEAGRHPATGTRTMPDFGTCGDCAHHHSYRWTPNKTFHKCDVHRLGQSHSSSSDIRVSWPACEFFKAKEAS